MIIYLRKDKDAACISYAISNIKLFSTFSTPQFATRVIALFHIIRLKWKLSLFTGFYTAAGVLKIQDFFEGKTQRMLKISRPYH